MSIPSGDTPRPATSTTSRVIQAAPATVYQAFLDPAALAMWMAPDSMTGKVHEHDPRVGGGYTMSLFYAASEEDARGKSGEQEDRYHARFVELIPPTRIVEAIHFDTTDPAFAGEMIMAIDLAAHADGTLVTIHFENIPVGIRPEDNDLGTRQSLAKLASYVETGSNGA